MSDEQPDYICPVCLQTYAADEVSELLCSECNSDLPGDVELQSYRELLERNTVEKMEAFRDKLASVESILPSFRQLLIERIGNIIDDKLLSENSAVNNGSE
jgi:hypothetical protein